MTVENLIQKLSTLPKDLEVIVVARPNGNYPNVTSSIDDIYTDTNVRVLKDCNNYPYYEFSNEPQAVIITADEY